MQKAILIVFITFVSMLMGNAQSIVPVSFNAGSSHSNGKIMLTAAIGNAFIPTDFTIQQDITTNNLIIKTENKEQNKENISIYPNPANDIIYFGNKSYRILSINIYNSTGQLVKSQSDDLSQNGTLRIADLTKGIYFVQFILEHSQTQTVKLIKL